MCREHVRSRSAKSPRLPLAALTNARLLPCPSTLWPSTPASPTITRDYRPSVASAFLTSDCEIPNWRAIAEGLTPALKAARTAFSLPVVRDPPPASMGAWWACVFASAANFSFDRCAERRPRRSASVASRQRPRPVSSTTSIGSPFRIAGRRAPSSWTRPTHQAAHQDPAAVVLQAQVDRRDPQGGDDQRGLGARRHRREQGSRCRSRAPGTRRRLCRPGLCHRDGRRRDADPRIAAEKLRLVEKIVQGRDFTAVAETIKPPTPGSGRCPAMFTPTSGNSRFRRSISPT